MVETTSLGFSWDLRGDTVCLRRNGYVVAVLRGEKAVAFLAEADGATDEELQQLLARLTGNYKRGNERVAANHPRNRHRAG